MNRLIDSVGGGGGVEEREKARVPGGNEIATHVSLSSISLSPVATLKNAFFQASSTRCTIKRQPSGILKIVETELTMRSIVLVKSVLIYGSRFFEQTSTKETSKEREGVICSWINGLTRARVLVCLGHPR